MKRIGIVLLVLMAITLPSLLADTYTPTPVKLYGSGGSADVVPTNGHSGLVTITPGHVSTANSTTDLLNIDEVFTGAWEDITNFGVIVISTLSDQASATNGLMVQFSSDGTEPGIISDDDYTVAAEAKKTFSFQAAAKYFRVVYTNNDSVNQGEFNLQTILKPYYVKPSSHRIQDAIVDDDDSELVKAVLTGSNPSGDFINFEATNGGNFKISIEEFENDVSSNSNTQLNVTPFHADGTEGNLITGVDYAVGKSGIDSSTETLQVISYEHHEIHGGKHYLLCTHVVLSINQVYDIQVTTPDTTDWGHFTFSFSAEGEKLWELYENVTINLAGATEPVRNNDRNSANVSGMLINGILNSSTANANADTVIAGATFIEDGIMGTGNKALGSNDRSREVIMKQNETHTFRFTATAAGYVNYCLSWYEHQNKN